MKWKAVEDRTYRIGYKSLSDWERKACCGSWFRFQYSKYKSNGSLWESEFSDIWVSERVFWTKMENDYSVRERTKMCVYTSLSFFFFLWEYTSLSISRDEIILDIYFKGWVRVALKKGRYLKPAHAGEQKLPAFI